MGYKQLLDIAKYMSETVRLVAYARYYKSLSINGLHYRHQVERSTAIAICKPNHTTHHEATTFLMSQLYDKKIGIRTVEGHAKNLKKFLDFLMVWGLEDELEKIHLIPVKKGGTFPLEVILFGFADYLRCIPSGFKPFSELKGRSHSIEWTILKSIPLNKHALAEGNLLPVIRSDFNKLKRADWCEYQPGALGPIIYTACAYLEFLRDRTKRYEQLPIEQIPRKQVRDKDSLVSGTTGSREYIIFNVDYIAKDSVTDGPSGGGALSVTPIASSEVFSESDANSFFKLLNPYEDAQDLLLFTILRYFGLRPGEASAIRINPSTIPANLYLYHQAREQIAASLGVKLQYLKEHGLHGNWVIETGWKTKASKRSVPLISHKARDPYTGEQIRFPTQDEFTDLIYWALVQRRDFMSHYSGADHGYLFVSKSNNSRGKPLSEKGVYSKFTIIAKKLFQHTAGQVDIRSFYPHTFRHLFATSLLLRFRRPKEEISKWLGHSSVAVTVDTYIHWIPDSNADTEKGEVSHMGKEYKRQADISEQALIRGE